MSDYASFDIEYDEGETRNIIYLAAIADNKGNEIAKHVSQFLDTPENPAEKQLVMWIQEQIYKYNTTFGYASIATKHRRSGKGINSDLKTIYDACQHYGIPSIVAIGGNGDPYIESKPNDSRKVHIDLYRIFSNPTIKLLFKGKYPNCRLETISMAFLGKGKYGGFSGKNVRDLSIEEQIKYAIMDTKLPLELVQWNDYYILKLMMEISNITGMGIETTCHKQMTNWWSTIIKKSGHNVPEKMTVGKFDYEGGQVLEPPQYHKYYDNIIYVLDVKSLYPIMMLLENLSPEIINCSCCADKPEARVSIRIMDLVNEQHIEKGREQRQPYWKCLDKKGAIPKLIENLIARKFEHERTGDKIKEKAVKLLLNGLYGSFANEFFDFSDVRVAELTTAYGRNTLYNIMALAKSHNYEVIYGDTDSIFVLGMNDETQATSLIDKWVKQNPKILIGIKGRYKSYYQSTKKQYWGIPLDPNVSIEIVGLDGSDDPELLRKLQTQFVEDVGEGKNPTIGLKSAYDNIQKGEVDHNLLKMYKNLGVDPGDYKQENNNKIIGITEELKVADTIWYYDIDKDSKEYRSFDKNNYAQKTQYLKDPNNICKANYTDLLRRRFEPQVAALGYNYDKDVTGMDFTTTTTTATIPLLPPSAGPEVEQKDSSEEKPTNMDESNKTDANEKSGK